jgi:hypothetical protein
MAVGHLGFRRRCRHASIALVRGRGLNDRGRARLSVPPQPKSASLTAQITDNRPAKLFMIGLFLAGPPGAVIAVTGGERDCLTNSRRGFLPFRR